MSINSETNEEIMAGNGKDSHSLASDDNNGKNASQDGVLKKGPWTSDEDAILSEYVSTYGEGNWNAVKKNTGLARCGKSCRLRWANHLRPDLKKGAFSMEEENHIAELHAKMGNKWARMAAEMPGRTDNEIKNYWNTRIKRKKRAGLPIYPPNICSEAAKDSQQKVDHKTTSSSHGYLEIPQVTFKNFNVNEYVIPLNFLDMPRPHISLPPHNFYPPTDHPSKRLRLSQSPYTCGDQFQNETCIRNGQHLTYTTASPSNVAISNGNPSYSEPHWAKKRELPSLQIQADNWASPSDSSDAFFQTLSPAENSSVSPHNSSSGLLDAVLHESKTMKTCDLQSPDASSMVVNTSSQDHPNNILEQHGNISSFIDDPSMYCDGTSNSFDEQEPLTGFWLEDEEAANMWDLLRCEDNNRKMY